jgi:PhzF family phenazine biosynthesis protein
LEPKWNIWTNWRELWLTTQYYLYNKCTFKIDLLNCANIIKMKKIPIYQVDAFTDKLFSGNPAAVCILDEWLDEDLMQNIAGENNLAETAFIVKNNDQYDIRWFTPTVEVELCGHATLASAYILFMVLNYQGDEIIFNSPRSGELKVTKIDEYMYLNFPVDILENCIPNGCIHDCIGLDPLEVYKGKTDYIAVVDNEDIVKNISPNFSAIADLDGRGLVVTSKGKVVDFVSRFFAPQSGINEDPVTGSAHTSLIPLWSEKLNKRSMIAKQLSKRGGKLICNNVGNRCEIGGKAKLYLIGEIYLT